MASYIDTSEITDWSHFFREGVRLNYRETAGTMSKGQNFSYCFYNCTDMTSGGTVDMRNAAGNIRSASYMFGNCTGMTDVTIIADKLSTWTMQRMFYKATSLTNLTIIGSIKVKSNDLDLTESNLSVESIVNLLNAFESNAGEPTTYKVYLGSLNIDKLTTEQIEEVYTKKHIIIQ